MRALVSSLLSPLALSLLMVSSVPSAEPPITAVMVAVGETTDAHEPVHWLVTGSQAGVQLRPSAEPDRVSRLIDVPMHQVHDLQQSPQRSMVAIAGGISGEDGTVRLIDWPSCELLRSLPLHQDVVYSVSWSEDGERLISCGHDRRCLVVSVSDGQVLAEFTGHSSAVTDACFVGELVVSCSLDHSLRVWDAATARLIRSLSNHTGPVFRLARQPGARRLPVVASAGQDRTIRFWQPTIGRMVRFIRLSDAYPLDLCWTSDGERLVAACSDGKLRVIDPLAVKVINQVLAVPGPAYSLTLDNRQSAYVGGPQGAVVRIDLAVSP